ncbi:acyl-CoA dehydrogenase family protein [Streptomyces sp. M10(2022)]
MSRLAQTAGLTDIQREILSTVRDFVDKEILPVATQLEHRDEYPTEIVEGLKELGLFGLMIPEEYGGLGESLLTYALCVEEIARGWMSVSGIINTHFIVAYMLKQHGTQEQKDTFLPRMALGEVRARSRCRSRPWVPMSPRSPPRASGTARTTFSMVRRCG